MEIRRLRSGDERVVADLATYAVPTRASEFLADERTVVFVAFDGEQRIGFLLAYELLRRHGDPSILFVYEIEVGAEHRRRGVGTALFRALASLARERGIRTGFVLTNESNEPAMRFYESLGGVRPNEDDVLWDFEFEER